MTTFMQLNAGLKKLFKWLVVGFGLKKECLVECATSGVKSEVILMSMYAGARV